MSNPPVLNPTTPSPLISPGLDRTERPSGTLNQHRIERAPVNDLSIAYIAKRIPTQEQRLIACVHERDRQKLEGGNRKSIFSIEGDDKKIWAFVTTREKTEILYTQTIPEENKERIDNYQKLTPDLQKTFFEGYAAARNLSLEQTKQLTERFFSDQVESGKITKEHAAFFLLELLKSDPNKDNNNYFRPNSFSNEAQRHLLSKVFNLIENEGGAALDALAKYEVMQKLQQLSDNNLQSRYNFGREAPRGELNPAIKLATDKAMKDAENYKKNFDTPEKKHEILLEKIEQFTNNISKKSNYLTPDFLLDLIVSQHDKTSHQVARIVADEYRNIRDNQGETAAINFKKEVKEIMRSHELDPLLPEGISAPSWVKECEHLEKRGVVE